MENNKSNKVTELLTEGQTIVILQILIYGVTPTISLLGIVGNVLSVLILLRHGLQRCSNILLLSLAVSDMAFLIGFNSVPKLVYDVVGDADMYTYSYSLSFFLYILYHIFHILDYASLGVSLTLPMFITLERLIAVFLPLKFQQVITPRRTWCVLFAVHLFWYAFFIHMSFYLDFSYENNTQVNMAVGIISRSQYHYDNLMTVAVLEETMSYLMMRVPAVLTLMGCVAIGVKVWMASTHRVKLSAVGSDRSVYRTTKVLLSVCTLYVVTCVVVSLPIHIPQYMYYTMTSDAPSNLGKVMYQLMNIVVCANCSGNFLIYVILNRNFRHTYKMLFLTCTARTKG